MASDQQQRICLVLLIGLPGVGKTTFCNDLKAFLSESNATSSLNFGLLHVCFDELLPLSKQREMALAAQNENSQPSLDSEPEKNFKSCRKGVHSMINEIICSLKNKRTLCQTDEVTKRMCLQYDLVCEKDAVLIVIDDNNYYQSMRYEYFQLARQNEIGFCEIYLKPDSLRTVIFNNSKRPDDEKIPESVINAMNDKLEPPNPFKNPWEQFSFSISIQSIEKDKNIYNLEMCIDALKAAIENPVKSLPEIPKDKTDEAKAASRKICSTNVYHISDKILRTMLNHKIKQAMKEEDCNIAVLGQKMNSSRSEVLKDLKTSMNEYISEELIERLTNQQEMDEDNTRAQKDLEKVISELFELKISQS